MEGISFPDTYPIDGQRLVLNGLGLRTLTIFNIKVYVAGLYVQQPSHSAQDILHSPGTKVIVMEFLHAGSKADIENGNTARASSRIAATANAIPAMRRISNS